MSVLALSTASPALAFTSSTASPALAFASSTCFLTPTASSLVPPQPLPAAGFSVPTALGFSAPQPLALALPGTDTPPPANRPTTPIPARIFLSSFASMVLFSLNRICPSPHEKDRIEPIHRD